MPRTYKRKFDWDEAKRDHAAGVNIQTLADRYGVSYTAVYRVVVPGVNERMRANLKRFEENHRVPCIEECGRTVSYIGARYHGGRCVECATLAKATSVRPAELQCATCREWKPDDAFPNNRQENGARRGKHAQCRPCQTIARRSHRQRNREAENAYSREYKRRRREAAA